MGVLQRPHRPRRAAEPDLSHHTARRPPLKPLPPPARPLLPAHLPRRAPKAARTRARQRRVPAAGPSSGRRFRHSPLVWNPARSLESGPPSSRIRPPRWNPGPPSSRIRPARWNPDPHSSRIRPARSRSEVRSRQKARNLRKKWFLPGVRCPNLGKAHQTAAMLGKPRHTLPRWPRRTRRGAFFACLLRHGEHPGASCEPCFCNCWRSRPARRANRLARRPGRRQRDRSG